MEGLIIGNISNTYKIKTEKNIYNSFARGKFKNEEIVPLVGDKVEIQITDEEKSEAVIEKILPRKNELKRPKVSNIEQVVFIISIKNPKPDLLMLDKQLAFAEYLNIKICIVLNKIDLDAEKEFRKIKEIYTKIGYEVIETRSKSKNWNRKFNAKIKRKHKCASG